MSRGGIIDVALADTMLKRHWLHPRYQADPRRDAIREKHRALHLAEQRMKKLGLLPSAPDPSNQPAKKEQDRK